MEGASDERGVWPRGQGGRRLRHGVRRCVSRWSAQSEVTAGQKDEPASRTRPSLRWAADLGAEAVAARSSVWEVAERVAAGLASKSASQSRRLPTGTGEGRASAEKRSTNKWRSGLSRSGSERRPTGEDLRELNGAEVAPPGSSYPMTPRRAEGVASVRRSRSKCRLRHSVGGVRQSATQALTRVNLISNHPRKHLPRSRPRVPSDRRKNTEK